MSIQTLSELSLDQLRQVIHLKEQINALEDQLNALFGGHTSISASPAPAAEAAPAAIRRGRGGRRVMSEEARARIVAAQKARWAAYHAARGGSARASAPRRTGTGMSAAGRAAIAAAQKARWAKVRGAKAAPAALAARAGRPARDGRSSPAARERARAAVMARWAQYRARQGK